ncbi:MAG TPA: VWA domain-containing protein [Phycisphaerae bacterium]|nr:VWA domain-containing protein [Phycisphaerae bacterium]
METIQLIWDRIDTFEFAYWELLFFLIPLLVLSLLRGKTGRVIAVRYSSLSLVKGIARSARGRFGGVASVILRFVAVGLLLCGVARPRIESGTQKEKTKGIDIMLVMDFSYSMQEGTIEVRNDDGEIEHVTYIDAMKRITRDFIIERPNDRLGVIGFAVEPYLVSALTNDHKYVMDSLENIKMDLGTAIGSAMVAGVRALDGSERATKIMIVVTDGNNNIGVSPFKAARYAYSKGIRIYPVEITPSRILKPRRIAAHPLYNVAKTSKGQFFQAINFESLDSLYENIDQLEKSFIAEERSTAHEELFAWFVIPGMLLLLIDLLLAQTLFRRLP